MLFFSFFFFCLTYCIVGFTLLRETRVGMVCIKVCINGVVHFKRKITP